jgi:hypothetical protein
MTLHSAESSGRADLIAANALATIYSPTVSVIDTVSSPVFPSNLFAPR